MENLSSGLAADLFERIQEMMGFFYFLVLFGQNRMYIPWNFSGKSIFVYPHHGFFGTLALADNLFFIPSRPCQVNAC